MLPGMTPRDTLIVAEVGSWPDVEIHPHRFGGVEFRIGRRELGHLHGDRLADFPFPRAVRDELLERGAVEPHHVLPESGWATRRMHDEADARDVIVLYRLQYERARARRAARTAA
jgi:hypothetical protein